MKVHMLNSYERKWGERQSAALNDVAERSHKHTGKSSYLVVMATGENAIQESAGK